MKIAIIEWSGSGNDCLRGFLRLAREEFVRDGHRVQVFGLEDPAWSGRLHEIHARERFDLALGMSGQGCDAFLQDGRLFWEALQLPFFNWNCDHPSYFIARHALRNAYLMHGYVFPDHARFAAEHLPVNGVSFAVHMGIPDRATFPRAPIPLAQRNGRVLFAKSGAALGELEAAWRRFGTPLCEILLGAAEEMGLRGSVRDQFPVLREVARGFGVELAVNSAISVNLLRELDNYLRGRRANLVLDAVLDFPVDVYGGGWDHVAWQGRKARPRGPAPWSDIVGMFPDYLACLSLNPFVDESVHDRSFYGLAANVVPIADSNDFSRSHMQELEPYAFRFDPASVQAAVEAVLARPTEAMERTESCWERLRSRFSMAASMRQIIGFASLVPGNQAAMA